MQNVRRNGSIVLGLRATREQRAWLTERAAARQMTVQALFDEAMLQQPDSPWMASDEVILTTPLEAKEAMASLCRIYRHPDPIWWEIATVVLRGLHGLVEQRKNRDLEGNQ